MTNKMAARSTVDCYSMTSRNPSKLEINVGTIRTIRTQLMKCKQSVVWPSKLSRTLDAVEMCQACQHKGSAGKYRWTRWQAGDAGSGTGYWPSYNLAPRDVLPCIVAGRYFNVEEERVLHPMQGDYREYNIAPYNARYEGLFESKVYSHPLLHGQRCVIVCDGYYEWKTRRQTIKGVKQPFFIYAKQDEGVKIEDRQTWKAEWSEDDGWKGIKLLKIPGIFDTWLSGEKKIVYSCSMITTNTEDIPSWLHHRIPMVLESEEEVADWLDYTNVSMNDALEKLHHPAIDSLQWHRVDPRVNDSRFNNISCYKPIVIEEKKDEASSSGMVASRLQTGSTSVENKSEIDAGNDESPTKRLKSG
nr:abasic site processing protein HMCES isoform X1 [Neodiprion pinetum]